MMRIPSLRNPSVWSDYSGHLFFQIYQYSYFDCPPPRHRDSSLDTGCGYWCCRNLPYAPHDNILCQQMYTPHSLSLHMFPPHNWSCNPLGSRSPRHRDSSPDTGCGSKNRPPTNIPCQHWNTFALTIPHDCPPKY